MLLIKDIRVDPGREQDLAGIALEALDIARSDVKEVKLIRRAVDARHRSGVKYVITLAVSTADDSTVLGTHRGGNVSEYSPPAPPVLPSVRRAPEPAPVVVGAGPAGLFAALTLCRSGAPCILLERGKRVEDRARDVDAMRNGGILSLQSNIQFGEGGAGTFSDGKLHTGIKSPYLFSILRELAENGAPEEILWNSEPHIGTDMLRTTCAGLRKKLLGLGCDIRFGHTLKDISVGGGAVRSLLVCGPETEYELPCRSLIMAPGQSAREVYEMLLNLGVRMHKKPFSVGVRIEHSQRQLDRERYGRSVRMGLPHSSYKVAVHLPGGRSVYSFCVCPGGEVIAAGNEPGGVVTNGMSPYARDGDNINGALLVSVDPRDLPEHPLSGLDFRRSIEEAAYAEGGGGYMAPVQLVGDFLLGRPSTGMGSIKPTYRPGVRPGSVDAVLPAFAVQALREALPLLAKKLSIFACEEAVMTAAETRSSSPVQLERDTDLTCTYTGLRVCGEGSGWAGGIMSSAADGIKCAVSAIKEFTDCD